MSQYPSVLSGLSVLVVESEPIVKDILIDVLESVGANTHFEERIQGAVAYLKAFIPDCILCNVNLPDGSGDSLIAYLRQVEATIGVSQTPAISVVDSNRVVQTQETVEPGFHAMITHPWRVQEVIDTVRYVTGRA